MVWLIIFLPLLNFPTNEGVNVKIDGSIDLGPKWNFEYSFSRDGIQVGRAATPHARPHADKYKKKHRTQVEKLLKTSDSIIKKEKHKTLKKSHKQSKRNKPFGSKIDNIVKIAALVNDKVFLLNKTHQLKIIPIADTQNTQKNMYKVTRNPDIGIYDKEHRVKEDTRIKELTIHVYNQALRVFDRIKKKIKNGGKVRSLKKSYKNKFTEFVNETQNMKIRTRLGTQKVILNTLDTSNRILRKLVNNLIAHTEDHAVLRIDESVANVLMREVNKEIQMEYKHVCHKYGLCRTGYGFTDFLADALNAILQNDDGKLKRAVDSVTEAVKDTDLGINDNHILKKFIKSIERVEKWDGETMKHMLRTLKNVLLAKNQPLMISDGMNVRDLNKTVAMLEILNILNENIPANEVNTMEWKNIKNSLLDYGMGNRNDIQAIMNAFVEHILSKGIQKFDSIASRSYMDGMKILLKEE